MDSAAIEGPEEWNAFFVFLPEFQPIHFFVRLIMISCVGFDRDRATYSSYLPLAVWEIVSAINLLN